MPLIHLDAEYWQPGWVEPDKSAWQARASAQAAGPRWVIDGNYGGTLPTRLSRATLVVWLDLPTQVCLAGAVRRAWRYRRGGRPDMAADCPERFNAEWLKFLWYILTFRSRQRLRIVRHLAASDVPIVHLTTTAARAAFAEAVAAMSPPDVQGIARLASSRIEIP